MSDELTDTQGAVDIDRDRALVLRCQEGDAAAFAELYTRYHDRLLRFCRRRLADSAEAEDVAQEAFVKAWRALPRFAGERRFYPWLTVIAGNLCTDVLRKRSRIVSEGDGDLDSRAGLADDDVSPEDRVVAAADCELAQKALQRLTVRHRRVLALREGSELSYQQIAAREGVDVSAVETLLWRARQALKREFTALSNTGGAAAVFGVGMVAVLRRAGTRMTNMAAAMSRRTAAVRFGGVPVREAAVALAVTTAAVTAGAQILHGPSGAASADPVHPSAIAAAAAPSGGGVQTSHVTSGADAGAASSAPSVTGALSGSPAATSVGSSTPSGDGAEPSTATTGSSASSGALGDAGSATPGLPTLPKLPQSVSAPSGSAGVSGLVGSVASTLPSVPGSSGSGGSASLTGVSSAVTGAVDGVAQSVSAATSSLTGATGTPSPSPSTSSVTSTLHGILSPGG